MPTPAFNILFLRVYFFLGDSLAAAAAGALVESRILIPIVRAPFCSFSSLSLFLSFSAYTRGNSVAWVEYRFHILSQKLLIFREYVRACLLLYNICREKINNNYIILEFYIKYYIKLYN